MAQVSFSAILLGVATAGAAESPLSLSTDASYGERRGLAMGVYRLIADTGSMLVPVLLGIIADASGFVMPFYFMAGMLIMNNLLVAIFAKEIIHPKYSLGSVIFRKRMTKKSKLTNKLRRLTIHLRSAVVF